MTEETLGATQQFLKNYVLNWFATVGRHLAYFGSRVKPRLIDPRSEKIGSFCP